MRGIAAGRLAEVAELLGATELALDSIVWSFGSPIYNPPYLSGIVSERSALEAMITRSDNTATSPAPQSSGYLPLQAWQ